MNNEVIVKKGNGFMAYIPDVPMYRVYARADEGKRFRALSSIRKMIFAPNLTHAAIFPADRLDMLERFLTDVSWKFGGQFEVRSVKTGKAVFSTLKS